MRVTNMVTTYNGREVLRSNCRKIKGEYFEINVDCFLVEEKWHRITNNLIVKNYTTGAYVKKEYAHNYLILGLVEITDTNGVIGYFESNNSLDMEYVYVIKPMGGPVTLADSKPLIGVMDDNILKYSKNSIPIISKDILPNNYFYGYGDNLLYPDIKEYQNKKTLTLGTGYGSLNYGSDGSLEHASGEHNKYFNCPITKEHHIIDNLVGNYSYGLEFETRFGYISKPILRDLGLIPIKDGSLRLEDGREPYEFVTVPLSGKKGIATLDNVCKVLTERTKFDNKCSLHLHLGGVPYDEFYIVRFVKLITMIQKELLTAFPAYKTDPGNYIGTKNYCRMLPSNIMPRTIPNVRNLNKDELAEYISASFNPIYHFVSDGQFPGVKYNRSVLTHPVSGAKWNINSRYSIVNLVPLMFKNFRTIEFRLHTPTSNRYKVFNWLLICSAFARYAERLDVITLNTLTIKEILETVYPPVVANRLNNYLTYRKKMFENEEDALGKAEFSNDDKYREIEYA